MMYFKRLMRGAARLILKRVGYVAYPKAVLPLTLRTMRAARVLIDLFDRIAAVDGAVVECGVGKGRSFVILSALVFDEKKGRKIWGFDSFEGFPEPTDEDASTRAPKAGEWAGTSSDDVRAIVRTFGMSTEFIRDSVKLVKGFFEDSLVSYDRKPIAFLHVDADLYESYVTVLETLAPFVAPGGIVLFDEYGEEHWPGATRAVDEFLSKHPWELEKHKGGKYFFIKT